MTIRAIESAGSQGMLTVVALRADTTISYISSSGQELTGRPAGDLVGLPFGDLLKAHQGPSLMEALHNAVDDGFTGTLGRHWLSSSHRQDVLVETFVDPAAVDGDGVLLALRDVTEE